MNVSDGELTDAADFMVYIADVNEPPHVTSLPASLSVGELSSGDVISIGAVDPEGGDVSYSYHVSPASGSAYFTGDSDGRPIYSSILNVCPSGLFATDLLNRVQLLFLALKWSQFWILCKYTMTKNTGI